MSGEVGDAPAAPVPAAYCTMVTNDDYVTPALVVARSLRNTQTPHPLFILATKEVTPSGRARLLTLYDRIVPVPSVAAAAGTRANLALIGRPDLHATLTKIHLWSLEKYARRVLYLDSDTLVLRNLDHLFELPQLSEVHDGGYQFAAAPELGYPDTFNAGLMLLTPSERTHKELLSFALVHESYDGGDQGLLNVFWGDGTRGLETTLRNSWKKRKGAGNEKDGARAAPAVRGPPSPEEERRSEDEETEVASEEEEDGEVRRDWFRLPFTYNMEMHKVFRLNIPAVLRYRNEHNVLHFIGKDKPWHFGPDGEVAAPLEGSSAYFEFYREMVKRWWVVRREVDDGSVA